LYTYRFGYLKLAPIPSSDTGGRGEDKRFVGELPTGLISAPISLHWLWTATHTSYSAVPADASREQRKMFVKKKATEMCQSW
uniref:Myotubularin phosphatase domain-containing protein n=1 Tax=Anisakis simplex TaxID=6269 RepID=A0A0M3JNU9_ANISI